MSANYHRCFYYSTVDNLYFVELTSTASSTHLDDHVLVIRKEMSLSESMRTIIKTIWSGVYVRPPTPDRIRLNEHEG